MSLDDLKIEVSKLSPKAGDLLILKHPNQLTWQARLEMQRCICCASRTWPRSAFAESTRRPSWRENHERPSRAMRSVSILRRRCGDLGRNEG
jgi:hypothetical protein